MSTKKMVFFFDQAKCVGCQSCEISCKVVNNIQVGIRYRKVISTAYTGTSIALRPHLSMSCNHCEDPVCMRVCPVGAYIKREDGLVVQDSDKCIGCQYCVRACPYHAPQFNKDTRRAEKCDFCAERLKNGIQPGCVEGCPTKALTFGEFAEIETKYQKFNSIPNLMNAYPNFKVKESSKLHATEGKTEQDGYTGEIGQYLTERKGTNKWWENDDV